MKNPNPGQIFTLAGDLCDDLLSTIKMLDGTLIQETVNNPQHPFRVGVREMARTMFGVTDIVAPPGARLHTVHIRFNPKRKWKEALEAGGPNTPSNYDVRKAEVRDQYPPTSTEEIEEDLVLLNYPSGDGNWGKALAWAQSMNLQNTEPREVFAIGEQHPKLDKQLGQNPMYVVATKDCSFVGYRSACGVWWDVSDRRAGLRWVSDFDDSNDWFAFRKCPLA